VGGEEQHGPAAIVEVQRAVVDLAPFDALTTERLLASEHRPLSPLSQRKYMRLWAAFESWCTDKRLRAFPASENAIRAYLLYLETEGLTHGTIMGVYTSIRAIHARRNAPLRDFSKVTTTLESIARRIGTKRVQKLPMLSEFLKELAKRWADGALRQKRDLAMLLLGFAAALRRSELARLQVKDVLFEPEGCMVHLDKRKTDQVAAGSDIAVPLQDGLACPVRALKVWLEAADIVSGPIWRPVYGVRALNREINDKEVDKVVKRGAAELGFDPKDFGGHSLRRGLMTSGARAGRRIEELMGTSGHKSIAVAQQYIQKAQAYRGAASREVLSGVPEGSAMPNLEHLRAKARDLYGRGYTVEQVRRILLRATTVDVSEATIDKWVGV
jgi:integrase